MGNAQRRKKQDPARDEFGRIDVPVFSPGTPGNPSVDIVRLGMVGGKRADSDQTMAPLSDVNNFVMLPDGTGMRIRDGFEYTDRYAVNTDPLGRQAYMIETAPPGVALGYRHMILNTNNELPFIYDAEYVRDRTQSFLGADFGSIFFESFVTGEQNLTSTGPSASARFAVATNKIVNYDIDFTLVLVEGTALFADIDGPATRDRRIQANQLRYTTSGTDPIETSTWRFEPTAVAGSYFFLALQTVTTSFSVTYPEFMKFIYTP